MFGGTEFGCILRAAFTLVAKKRQSAVHEMNGTKRNNKHKSNMKVTEVKGLLCPHCDTFIQPDDVTTPTVEAAMETKFKCEECGAIYDDKEDAETCCEE